jgi:hypothetical protein
MRTDEQLRAALRRPDLPWPDEVGAYQRFLRRRARRARAVRVATGIGAAAAVLALAAVTSQAPWKPTPPVATSPTLPPPPTLSDIQRAWFDEQVIGERQLVSKGQHNGWRWTLVTARAPGGKLCLWAEVSDARSGRPGAESIPCPKATVAVAVLQHGTTRIEGTGLQTRDVEGYLLGWAPAATARVRIQFWRHDPVVVGTLGPARLGKRYWLAFIAPATQYRVVVALDAQGRELARLHPNQAQRPG